mmetsp:Transcript_4368/g.12214  ORF Transcript_4368/g.12214 Transcript_4368/m.12214 type:complete len:235 (-) Transcript_4368:68-772(-)
MDFDPLDRDNLALQVALREFQKVADSNDAACGIVNGDNRERQRQRLLGEEIGKALMAEAEEAEADKEGAATKIHTNFTAADIDSISAGVQRRTDRRWTKLKPDLPWDPWHPLLMPDYFFYGYEGSLTEPPCSEVLEWHVFTEPMFISKRQHRQMQELLFNQIDPNHGCRRTGVHFEGSVARPVQPLRGRELYKCSCRDFISDYDRKWYGRNRCWPGDEYMFHPDEFPTPAATAP